jgi:hypothetical protein
MNENDGGSNIDQQMVDYDEENNYGQEEDDEI